MTEGGYDLGGLASSLRAVIPVLDRGPERSAPLPSGSARRGQVALDAVLPVVRQFWQL
jgi:hypothetical protein